MLNQYGADVGENFVIIHSLTGRFDFFCGMGEHFLQFWVGITKCGVNVPGGRTRCSGFGKALLHFAAARGKILKKSGEIAERAVAG